MFGTDSDGAVTGLRVLSHTETPGLGAKITTAHFRDQFNKEKRLLNKEKPLRLEDLALKKDDPAKGQIDAITGATISSRRVTEAIRSTLETFNKQKAGGGK